MKKPLAKFGYKKLIIIMSAAVLLVAGIIAAVVSLKSDSGEEKVFFCDFENYGNTFSSESYYEDRTVFKYCESGGVDDSACLMIESSEANDARYVTEIKLKAKKLYLISGYVKTENIGGENAFGANISVMESTNRTIPTATSAEGWQKLEYCVRADKSGAVKLALRLGFYSGDTSGKVWFDNISVRRIKSVPDGMTPVDLSEKLGGGTSVTDGAEYNENTYNDMKFISLIIAAAFLTVFLVAYRFSRGYDGFFGGQAIEHPDGQGISLKGSIVFIFAAAVLLRIILAVSYYQCDFDVNLFKYWADTALNKGFTNVYGELGSNLDYPPVFLYFLYIASCLNKTLNFFGNAQAGFYTLLVKMPSILADCAIGYIIYYFESLFFECHTN